MNEPTQDTMSNDSQNMTPARMPLYTCHKQVRAARIVRTELLPQHQPSLVCLEFAGDADPQAVLVSDDWLVRRTDTETVDAALTKAVGGYFIQYDNGYTSWSPADAFEEGYHLGDGAMANTPTITVDPAHMWELASPVPSRLLEGYDIREHNPLEVYACGLPGVGGGHADYMFLVKGSTVALGSIHFQDGPIGEVGLNGISHEALLAVVLDRLRCFQSSEYVCHENKMAQFHLTRALEELHARTRRRIARGVEGTHEV